MKVQDYAQMIGYITRDKTTDVPGSMAHELKMASVETDKIKEEMNKKFGPGTMKYGSEIKQPEMKIPQAIFEFGQRNPAAEGGRMLNAIQVGEDRGDRTGFRKPKKITDFPLEIQERIKEFGIKKYNKLNNQEKYSVRNPDRTSTTPYDFTYGKKKISATIKGLTKKGADNVQKILNIINNEKLTPENWFGKTSRKQGKKGGASAGVDILARDLVKYLKGETIVGRTAINQIIFDQLNIKDLIGNKADIIKDIDGKSFRQAKGTAAASKTAVESSFDAVKLINKEFILDPDITLDELAEQIYGKGASNSVRAMKDTQLDILKYLDVLKTGTRRGIKIPNFDYPSKNKIFEILDSIEDRSGTFGFQDGAVRDLKFNIRDNLLNYKKGSTMDLRRMLSEIISESDLAGRVIDESVGLSATYDTMPGYTEATQMLPDELNKYKAFKVDKPFNDLLKKIGDETATPKEIKDYNKVARAFIKETGADAPIIRSSILDDDLKNVKKYVKNFDDFSPAAQKDILDVAKKNKIIIETTASPLTLTEGKATMESAQKFFDENKNLKYKQLQNIALKGGAKGKAAARALQIIAAGGLGYSMEDILKGTGLMDKEYELTASAGDAPLVEKGLSTGEKAAIGTGAAGTIGTKTGRKLLGKLFNVATGPTGMGAFTYALRPEGGYDLSRTGDRLGFEVEAALAPTLVKGVTDVSSKIKNPFLRKGLETLAGVRIPKTFINPANVLRAAKVASPIGIASLAGEGLLHLGKKGYDQYQQMQGMTESEKQNFLADQYEDLGGVFGEGA